MTAPPKFGMFSARRALSPDSARVANDVINISSAQEAAETVNFTRTDAGQVLPNSNHEMAHWRRTHYPQDPAPYTADDIRAHRSNQPSTSNPFTASPSSLQAPPQTFLHQFVQPSPPENPFSRATLGPGTGRMSPWSEALVRRYANGPQTDQALMGLVNNARQGKGFKSSGTYQDFLNKNHEQKTRTQWGIGQYSLNDIQTARQTARQQYHQPSTANTSQHPSLLDANRMVEQALRRQAQEQGLTFNVPDRTEFDPTLGPPPSQSSSNLSARTEGTDSSLGKRVRSMVIGPAKKPRVDMRLVDDPEHPGQKITANALSQRRLVDDPEHPGQKITASALSQRRLVDDPEHPGQKITASALSQRRLVDDPEHPGQKITANALSQRRLVDDPEHPGQKITANALSKRRLVDDPEHPGQKITANALSKRRLVDDPEHPGQKITANALSQRRLVDDPEHPGQKITASALSKRRLVDDPEHPGQKITASALSKRRLVDDPEHPGQKITANALSQRKSRSMQKNRAEETSSDESDSDTQKAIHRSIQDRTILNPKWIPLF